jgi:hypothetical protein
MSINSPKRGLQFAKKKRNCRRVRNPGWWLTHTNYQGQIIFEPLFFVTENKLKTMSCVSSLSSKIRQRLTQEGHNPCMLKRDSDDPQTSHAGLFWSSVVSIKIMLLRNATHSGIRESHICVGICQEFLEKFHHRVAMHAEVIPDPVFPMMWICRRSSTAAMPKG